MWFVPTILYHVFSKLRRFVSTPVRHVFSKRRRFGSTILRHVFLKRHWSVLHLRVTFPSGVRDSFFFYIRASRLLTNYAFNYLLFIHTVRTARWPGFEVLPTQPASHPMGTLYPGCNAPESEDDYSLLNYAPRYKDVSGRTAARILKFAPGLFTLSERTPPPHSTPWVETWVG
jgi:hypothetical protein